ncbi:DUF1674 domain-containing protein [Stappia sp. F7233]|uniref:DUF1674 domain-containing protein n=1 Tax=Stappia albiluteola TaxID=2758565 RepID=A0A839AFJ2_9HYPH|nr:DUF1674 domain-containing protein [Stappia albiluteola]MBA5778620.1 DUF1674 domain-containing protein [Stappia albiluteola]
MSEERKAAPEAAAEIDGVTLEEAPRRRFEDLPPAAQRALLEAQARREAVDEKQKAMPREVDGRGGLDPARYDDWEIKGIAVDF